MFASTWTRRPEPLTMRRRIV